MEGKAGEEGGRKCDAVGREPIKRWKYKAFGQHERKKEQRFGDAPEEAAPGNCRRNKKTAEKANRRTEANAGINGVVQEANVEEIRKRRKLNNPGKGSTRKT